jgi:hypothetical protein
MAIPDCVEFFITTHACRGYCESWSVPSEMDTVIANPHQAITSVGQCCNIMETEDVSFARQGNLIANKIGEFFNDLIIFNLSVLFLIFAYD